MILSNLQTQYLNRTGLFSVEGDCDTRYFVFVSKVNYIKEPSEIIGGQSINYEASLIWVDQQGKT